ncbi:MAG: ABC transporter ATP-binding protein/permease [Defluviitaleaceae bacterium]|nr:ABC transporter ATP-binding protein/permease [Defluviitaleaceae bacterium]
MNKLAKVTEPIKVIFKNIITMRIKFFIVIIFSAIFNIVTVLIVYPLINSAVGEFGRIEISLIFWFIIFIFLQQIFTYLRNQFFDFQVENFCNKMHKHLLSHLENREIDSFEKYKDEFLSKYRDVSDRIRNFLKNDTQNIIFMPLMFIFSFTALIYLNIRIAAIIIIIVIISSIVSIFRKNNISNIISEIIPIQKNISSFEKNILENREYISASNTQNYAVRKHNELLEKREDLYFKFTKEKLKSYRPALMNEYLPTIVLIGLAYIFYDELNYGEFTSILLLVNMVSLPFGKMLQSYVNYFGVRELIFSTLNIINNKFEHKEDYEQDRENHLEKESKIVVDIKNMSFGFENATPIFENVDFKLNKGEKIAIIGESGIGKSTFLKLIMGIYKPTKGSINIYGRDSYLLRKNNWEQISYFDGNYNLIDNTLAYNITFSDELLEQKDLERIEDISKTLNMSDIVNKNTLYNTVGQFGKNLSEGQKLKICLSRLLYKDSEILILDEPTSHLDVESEEIFSDFIRHTDKSVILVTHNMNTAASCEVILNFNEWTK